MSIAPLRPDVTGPTYRPSPEQFAEPIQYIETIKRQAKVYGMCSVVPPQEWKVSLVSDVKS